jgi:AcrR family transcriptional regulator
MVVLSHNLNTDKMSSDVNNVKMIRVSDRRPADRYHHGDLRNALVGAATALARGGGPDAVVLREAARQVGVSAAAAYHHFAGHEELVGAVKQRALDLLTEEMRSAIARDGTPVGDPVATADAARRRLRALGAAYLRFAAAEPGLFRLTFGPRGGWPADRAAGSRHAATGPFHLLSQALDELTAAGALPAGRRPGLEYVVWAAVHGIAVLRLDGPLASADPVQQQRITEQTLDTVIRGL